MIVYIVENFIKIHYGNLNTNEYDLCIRFLKFVLLKTGYTEELAESFIREMVKGIINE